MAENREGVCVAAMDPGTTNIATWIGVCDPAQGTVRTISMTRRGEQDFTTEGARGTHSAKDASHDKTKKEKCKCKHKGKMPVYAISAEAALQSAQACLENKVTSVVVETAPQWNMAARISAATIYGVFRGRGLPVQFSSSVTKARAMRGLADKWHVTLTPVPDTLDRKNKGDAEKIRRINKQNSKAVAKAAIEASKDEEGLRVLELYRDKQDDVCDAMLLACGPLFASAASATAAATPKRKRRKIESDDDL